MAIRNIKDTLNDAGDTVTSAVREGVQETTAGARQLGERLRANGAELQDELLEASERFVDGAKRIGEATSEQIRLHPLAAFGIAFAAGVIMTKLLRSR